MLFQLSFFIFRHQILSMSSFCKKILIILFTIVLPCCIYAQNNIRQSSTNDNKVLPVTLTSFTAKSDEINKIVVNWSTSSEANNSYFEVLISKDGHNFVKIGQVQGVGNSNTTQHYQFVIHNIASITLTGSLPFLLFLLIPSVRNRKLRVYFYVFFAFMIISCAKNKDQENLTELKKYYINLQQVDNDGKTTNYGTFIQRVTVKVPKS